MLLCSYSDSECGRGFPDENTTPKDTSLLPSNGRLPSGFYLSYNTKKQKKPKTVKGREWVSCQPDCKADPISKRH